MASCYRITYVDRFGSHVAFKWGEDSREALGFLKKNHPNAEFGTPEELPIQPFTDKAREICDTRWGRTRAAADQAQGLLETQPPSVAPFALSS